MPYILSPMIQPNSPGLWGEGNAYEKQTIYSIEQPNHPPVNYDAHLLKPHSLPHMEVAAHTNSNAKTVDDYYQSSLNYFYGEVLVVKLPGSNWLAVTEEIFLWEVTLDELKCGIETAQGSSQLPAKLILSVEDLPVTSNGTHDPNFVLVLSQESADYLISNQAFNLYGTSWKSSDFQPNSSLRPIHNTLFQQAVIFECLDLAKVPQGNYIFMGFPLPLVGASESPVCPVLFSKTELSF